LIRIPLGVAFVFVAGDLIPAVVIVAAAALSDMLDGWVARRARPRVDQQRHRGDWLDPFCDKLFVAAVMIGLYVQHAPPLRLLALTMTREILQTLSMLVYQLVPRLRGLPYNYRAHPIGKLTTVAQFTTALAILLRHRSAEPLAWVAAVLGLLSVIIYWQRARSLARSAA
jgi:cardiolipin synthase (CMP-forming)